MLRRRMKELLALLSIVTLGLLLAHNMFFRGKSKVMHEGRVMGSRLYEERVSSGTECRVRRQNTSRKSDKTLLKYINKIKSCPCNVNVDTELNPLCATTDTLEKVVERTRVEFLPETASPCFFIDNDGDHYYIANTSNREIREKRFLQMSSQSQLGCLPSVFLLGVGKTATTEMHALLAKHPQIRGASHKEMMFWVGGGSYERMWYMDDDNNTRYNLFTYIELSSKVSKTIHRNVTEALKMQRHHEQNSILDFTLILDSSTNNYFLGNMRKIFKFLPNARVILSMRDPVEREFSKFRFAAQLHFMKDTPFFKDQTPKGFDKYVRHILTLPRQQQFPQSYYSMHVKNMLQTFPREQVGFVQFEEFIKDPIGTLERDVLPVFGVGPFMEKAKKTPQKTGHHNRSAKVYKMLRSTRKALQDHFRAYNKELSQLLNNTKWTWGY